MGFHILSTLTNAYSSLIFSFSTAVSNLKKKERKFHNIDNNNFVKVLLHHHQSDFQRQHCKFNKNSQYSLDHFYIYLGGNIDISLYTGQIYEENLTLQYPFL